jgi:MGT family glycosyltransferase
MARFLAYTSPAAGHLFPLVPGLLELVARGHDARVIGPAGLIDAVPVDARPLDPRIAEVEVNDYEGSNSADRLARAIAGLMSRGELEIEDLDRAIAAFAPDALLIDTNAYGALVAAERSGLPFALINPSVLAWPGRGIPPYGLGLAPMRGPLGRVRDTVLTKLVVRTYAKAMMPRLNALRTGAGLEPLAGPIDHMRRPDRLFVLSGEPLEYPRVDTPEHVRFVGAQIWDPPVDVPQWLREDGDPWVLVTCSTDYQGDEALAAAAIEALRDEPVRVIVTLADAHGAGRLPSAPNVRVERFVPHGPVLERAAAVICHSGMGIVQKAIAARVPIVAVPFGRDQPEVSRRVAECGTGVLLKRKDLSAMRLKSAVREARGLRLDRQLSGGSAAFADAASEMVTAAGLELEAHGDRSLIR